MVCGGLNIDVWLGVVSVVACGDARLLWGMEFASLCLLELFC